MAISILINARSLIMQRTGIGQYTYHIVKRILERDDVFVPSYQNVVMQSLLPGHAPGPVTTDHIEALRQFLQRHPTLKSVVRTGVDMANRVTSLARPPYDIAFEPNITPPLRGRFRRLVTTVHDFSCGVHPEWHPADRVRHFTRQFRKRAATCDMFVTGANYIRHQAMEHYGIAADHITVIPYGVAHDTFRLLDESDCLPVLARHDLPRDYLLFVGTIEPRKNLATLLQAYDSLPEAAKKAWPLVVVGGNGWLNDDLFTAMKRMAPHVRYLGYVDEAGLVALLNRATLFIYPSWYEGFGLPVLEAMACGCPVVAANRTALPEVCGDAAVLVDPGDAAAMGQTLLALLEDPATRQRLRERGLARCRRFTWEATADAHLELFTRLARA